MSSLGSSERPRRVAVIGSGPAGFYTVQHLFEAKDLTIECDVFDRLPTPFGLVRLGVAPDHQKIKTVVKVYNKLAANPDFKFFGHVEYGKDISLADLPRALSLRSLHDRGPGRPPHGHSRRGSARQSSRHRIRRLV